jgi:hypothetical protein
MVARSEKWNSRERIRGTSSKSVITMVIRRIYALAGIGGAPTITLLAEGKSMVESLLVGQEKNTLDPSTIATNPLLPLLQQLQHLV